MVYIKETQDIFGAGVMENSKCSNKDIIMTAGLLWPGPFECYTTVWLGC